MRARRSLAVIISAVLPVIATFECTGQNQDGSQNKSPNWVCPGAATTSGSSLSHGDWFAVNVTGIDLLAVASDRQLPGGLKLFWELELFDTNLVGGPKLNSPQFLIDTDYSVNTTTDSSYANDPKRCLNTWSICPNGTLAAGNTAVFWLCNTHGNKNDYSYYRLYATPDNGRLKSCILTRLQVVDLWGQHDTFYAATWSAAPPLAPAPTTYADSFSSSVESDEQTISTGTIVAAVIGSVVGLAVLGCICKAAANNSRRRAPQVNTWVDPTQAPPPYSARVQQEIPLQTQTNVAQGQYIPPTYPQLTAVNQRHEVEARPPQSSELPAENSGRYVSSELYIPPGAPAAPERTTGVARYEMEAPTTSMEMPSEPSGPYGSPELSGNDPRYGMTEVNGGDKASQVK